MARNAEEAKISKDLINDTIQYFNDVEKREGTVSPIIPGLIRVKGAQVPSFSSQYGSESSLSYVAINLAGQLSVFPRYGDYTQACVLRTYGPWWKNAPSKTEPYRGTPSDFTSEDFVEVRFSEYLYPVRIEIYETYNPGAVVRILACDDDGGTDTDRGQITWAILWDGGGPVPTKQRPRIFAPPLRKINFSTHLIRIELNSTCLDYYTELDGVKLLGTQTPPLDQFYDNLPPLCFKDEDWGEKIKPRSRCCLRKKVRPLGAACQDLQALMSDLTIKEDASDEEDNFFTILPRELMQLILSYLDSRDLCRLAQTCGLLRDNCYDPLLYLDLNLQPFWSQISGVHLSALESRCERVQRINLSWLGAGGHIAPQVFKEFLKCIKSVQTLELSCCKFINSSCLISIAETCKTLTELNLSGCTQIDDFSIFNMVSLGSLKRLNLYRTKIDGSSLLSLIRTNPNLEHLNIGSCVNIYLVSDLVLNELGGCCKKLKSLDMWRIKNISDEGLASIYNNCLQLEELDIGWSVGMSSESECFINLAQRCQQLKKVFFTANRTLRDCDLRALADHCPRLQQLDILGTRNVTGEAVLYLLERCTELVFLDVSFCVGITEAHTCSWRATYPHVNIKKSFQELQPT